MDLLGGVSEELEAPLPNDVRKLVALLKQRGGDNSSSVHITVNKQITDMATPLQAGDEEACISAWI